MDVVVNNAGYSLSGDTESATEEQSHQEIETLFFGTARVTMRAVREMRQDKNHRGGVIFNVSSLAGVCAFPGHASITRASLPSRAGQRAWRGRCTLTGTVSAPLFSFLTLVLPRGLGKVNPLSGLLLTRRSK